VTYGEEDSCLRDPWWEANGPESPGEAQVLSTTTGDIFVPASNGTTAGINESATSNIVDFYNGYYYPWGWTTSTAKDAFAVAKMLVETKRVDLKSAKDFIALVEDLKKVL